MRRICYVTGTRADFGLMESTLRAIQAEGMELFIVATGMHLSPQFGETIHAIEDAQFTVSARVHVDMSPATGATMARNLGRMVTEFVSAFEDIRPDLLLVLGDRGEMLAGAIAGIHLNIPIVHVHGGERSGTVDEPVRHAISKLSHFHFAATAAAAERLVRMGEHAQSIFVTGAPGLDGLRNLATCSRQELIESARLRKGRPIALMVYHPVLQEAESAGQDTDIIIDALLKEGVQIVALMPNSDAGSDAVRSVLMARAGDEGVRMVTHFPRPIFVSWMAAADVMIGNSSAGIIEAATFATPVINIGTRQGLRERNTNVVDVPVNVEALSAAIRQSLAVGRQSCENIYGDGNSAGRIARLLSELPLGPAVLMKSNGY